MNVLCKSALGMCCAALGISQVFPAGTIEIAMICDNEKLVIILLAGHTLDTEACATMPLPWAALISTRALEAFTSISPSGCGSSRASPRLTTWH